MITMERKWAAWVTRSKPKKEVLHPEFAISTDLYQRLCEDIEKGIHFADDPETFDELKRHFDKHCLDHGIELSNEDNVRFQFSSVDNYLQDIFNIDLDLKPYFFLGLIDKEEDFLPLLHRSDCFYMGKKIDSIYTGEKIGERKYIINGLVIEYDERYLIRKAYFDFGNPKYNICSCGGVDLAWKIFDYEPNYRVLKVLKEALAKTFQSKKLYRFDIGHFHCFCYNAADSLDIYPSDYIYALGYLSDDRVIVDTHYDSDTVRLIYRLKEAFGIKALQFFLSADAKKYESFDGIPVASKIIAYIQEHSSILSPDMDELEKKIAYYDFVDTFSIFYREEVTRFFFRGDHLGAFRNVPSKYLYDVVKQHFYAGEAFLGDYSYDFSAEEYQKAFDEMLANEVNAERLLCLSPNELPSPQVRFWDNYAFDIKPLYEDIILETRGLDEGLIEFDYSNGDIDSFLSKRSSGDTGTFRTSIILNHLRELIGFVCQCSIKDIPQDVLKRLLDSKAKLICDDIVLNTRNIDTGYDIYLSSVYGLENKWHPFMCQTEEGHMPEINSLDDGSIEYKDGLIVKCRGYKDSFYAEDMDDYNHYVMKLDPRVKGFAKGALVKPRNVLIFYDGNMLDATHLLDGYDGISNGVIVCRDGVISKANIKHIENVKSIKAYYSGSHMQNQTLLSGLKAIRKNQIFTFVTCDQMQFINNCGMNSRLPEEAMITMLNGEEVEDYLDGSILDIDVFVSVVDPDFEAG